MSLEQRPVPTPQLSEVSPGILAYIQPDGGWMVNNAGAVLGPEGTVLVDTSSTQRRTGAFLQAVVAAAPDRPLRTLINTHHHGDHTYGNCFVGAGTTIVGHRLCRAELLRAGFVARNLFPEVYYGDIELAPPTLTFDDRLTVHVGELRLEVIYVGPAHTLGDVVIWVPDARVVFTGDLVFAGGHPFLAEGCAANYPTALRRVRDLDPLVVVPGHGPVRGPDVLEDMSAYAEWLLAQATEAHAAGLPPLEAARRADLGRFAGWNERERVVGNLIRAYSELDGQPWGAPLPLPEAVAAMTEYAGSRLRSFA